MIYFFLLPLFQISATNLRVLELESENLEDSDIVVTMAATAMDSHKRDETDVSIKINTYEYFSSSKIPIEFEIYHPISNNYLLRTSESIQRGSSFMLSGNLESIDKIHITYLTFVNFFNNSNRTIATSSSTETAREIMSSIGSSQKKRKGKGKATTPIKTKFKIPKLANLAVQNVNINENDDCATPTADNEEENE